MGTDLLGFESDDSQESMRIGRAPLVLTEAKPRGKHYVEPRGYAAMPGTGPADKQCRHCAHYAHQGGVAGSYPKCAANRARWTGGRASDILAKAPACSKFKDPTRDGDGGRDG